MCVERFVRLTAGAFVLGSAALVHLVSPWFLLLTVFVGANLAQSALTGWCPLISILRWLEVPECGASTARMSPAA